jgi:hypothetical protein
MSAPVGEEFLALHATNGQPVYSSGRFLPVMQTLPLESNVIFLFQALHIQEEPLSNVI